MSTFLSFLFSKTGLYAAIALALFLAGFVACWKLTHLAERTFESTQTVISAANGATLNVQAGLLKRQTRPVCIAGIAAPGLNDPLGPESRDNLAGLAGDTVRVISDDRPLGSRPLVGQVFGDTGADLAIAQLAAGLAKCETKATKEQIAAQKQAEAAQRGLWTGTAGSHWWHFGAAAEEFPEATPIEPEKDPTMIETGLLWLEWILGAAIVVALLCAAWQYVGAPLLSKWSGAATVTTAVNVTEQTAAYAELSLIRYIPTVANDPEAVSACEYLCKSLMVWPKPATAATTPSTQAKNT